MRTVDAQPQHAEALLYRMPTEQRERLLNRHGPRAASAIRDNIRKSPVTWCGVDDKGVVNLGGVLPTDDPSLGYLWQFVTPAIARHKRSYIEQGRLKRIEAFRHFPRIGTVIEADYLKAIRHTKRFGARVLEVPPLVLSFPAFYCEATNV